MATAPNKYDAIFARHAGPLPIAYLRALSIKESGLNPVASSGPAVGLMQITDIVRRDYNARHGTSVSREQLSDPNLNVKIGADTLKRIVASYQKNHPSSPHLQPNWGDPEFVKLVTQGWNAGWAEGGGVGRVAKWLEARGIPVTHDSVTSYAAQAGAASFLSDPNRARWHRSVADLYYAQPDAETGSVLGKLLLTALFAWGAYKLLS